MKVRLLIFAAVVCARVSFGQLVCVGTKQGCREALKKVCAAEMAEANLLTVLATKVHGRIIDETGAPFTGNYVVQVRGVKTGQVLRSSALDAAGKFAIEAVPAGRLRMIVVMMKAGVAARTGFEQPPRTPLRSIDDCNLDIVLRAMPTDQEVSMCPVE